MTKKRRQNYGGAVGTITGELTKPGAIIAIAVGFVIILFGVGTLFSLIRLFTSPVTSGQIPMWAILVIVLAFFWIKSRSRPRYPPRGFQ